METVFLLNYVDCLVNTTRLIDYFEQEELITKAQADEIRVEQSTSNMTEEALLLTKKYVNAEDIAKAKSSMFNIPYVDLKSENIEDGVFSAISLEKLKRYNAVPFSKAGHVIKVGMSDPFDVQAIQAIESLMKPKLAGRILVYIATKESVDFVLDSHIGGMISTEVSQALEDVGTPVTELEANLDDSLDTLDLKNAPVARIVNSILQYAIKTAASDIHIEPAEKQLRVRFRINGVMLEKLLLPPHLKEAVVARLKIMSDLKIDEKRAPQDGRLQVVSGESRFDVRVSTLPSIHGEKVVMRLLDGSTGVPSLETTGLRGSGYKIFLDGISATNGIILVTGPTGSGKTRTLAGALDRLNSVEVNIITIENPVEIKIPGVTQVQVNPDANLTFSNGLRSILRQDPDIIMVGEIRDEETAHLAVEASLTGHLVLATLHTNSAAAAIPRLLDMGIENYLLASTMRIAAAQRLPRRVCRDCMVPYKATPQQIAAINDQLGQIEGFDLFTYLSRLGESIQGDNVPEHLKAFRKPEVGPDGEKVVYLYKGEGCSHCGGTGYKGRIGIFEVMDITPEMVDLIMNKATEQDMDKLARKQGMISMVQDGYLKAIESITTIEEVLRVSKE